MNSLFSDFLIFMCAKRPKEFPFYELLHGVQGEVQIFSIPVPSGSAAGNTWWEEPLPLVCLICNQQDWLHQLLHNGTRMCFWAHTMCLLPHKRGYWITRMKRKQTQISNYTSKSQLNPKRRLSQIQSVLLVTISGQLLWFKQTIIGCTQFSL